MTREDLYQHYKTHYTPNNAMVVVVGDFKTRELLKQVEELFGGYAMGEPQAALRSVEPAQNAERRVLLEKPGTTAYFRVVYHTPEAGHADTPALIVLDAILSGGKSISFFGGGVGLGKSSRLYRALVEKQLAADVSSSYGFNHDPGLFDLTATVLPGKTLAKVEDAVFAEVDRIASKPPTRGEVAKAVKQTRAQFAYTTERVSSLAYMIGMLECVHSYEDISIFTERLAEVTAKDVQRAAQTYLTKSNRTVGWFNPIKGKALEHR
jgi:zinc protease